MEKLRVSEAESSLQSQMMISLEEKCRKITQLLNSHNKGEKIIPDTTPEINENELDDLEKEIQKLQKHKDSELNRYIRWHKRFLGVIEGEEKDTNIVMIKLKEK